MTVWRDERGAVLEQADDVCDCAANAAVYDAAGRRISTLDPMADQNVTVTSFDKAGRVTAVTRHDNSQDTGIEADKAVVTQMVYDARGRRITLKEKIGSATWAETVFGYGKRDQLTRVTSPTADVALTEYNEQLWTTEETQETAGDDVITQYVHDADGRTVTYRAKNATTGDQETLYAYDLQGRLTQTTWPDAGTTAQTYDLGGRRVSTTDPIGTVAVRSYDADNRLTAIDLDLGTNVLGITAVEYAHDALGRITLAATDEGDFTTVVERTWNTLGKLESETQIVDGWDSGAGRTIVTDWNVAGQKVGVTYPVSGDVIVYTRDELDRVDRMTRNGTEIVDWAFSGPRIIGKEYPGSRAKLTYDAYGRLTRALHENVANSDPLLQLDLGYDAGHAITHQDRLFYDDVENTRIEDDTSDLGSQYAYDGAGRLVTVLRGVPTAEIGTAIATNIANNDYDDKVEYLYDQTGNRVTWKLDGSIQMTYGHNTVNELTTEGPTTRTYDAAGNQQGNGGNVLRYDWKNQLALVDIGGGDRTFHLDAFGRIVQQDAEGSAQSIRSYWDGDQKVVQVRFTDATPDTEVHARTWVYGERIDDLIQYVNVTPNPDEEYWSHGDHLGSVMLMVSSTGRIQESYRYTEWGEVTVVDEDFDKLAAGAASPIDNSVLYTGQRRAINLSPAGETWYDYRARQYRAEVGRFVQRDPLGYVDGGNGYQYVRTDPTNKTDPYGMQSWVNGQSPPGPGGPTPVPCDEHGDHGCGTDWWMGHVFWPSVTCYNNCMQNTSADPETAGPAAECVSAANTAIQQLRRQCYEAFKAAHPKVKSIGWWIGSKPGQGAPAEVIGNAIDNWCKTHPPYIDTLAGGAAKKHQCCATLCAPS